MNEDGAVEAAISVVNLRVSYGDREILHGITFDVRRGEVLVIAGGSGEGDNGDGAGDGQAGAGAGDVPGRYGSERRELRFRVAQRGKTERRGNGEQRGFVEGKREGPSGIGARRRERRFRSQYRLL